MAPQTDMVEIPSTQELEEELKRVTNRKNFMTTLRGTIFTLITVAAVAILVAVLLLPVLHIYGSSMNPLLVEGDIVLSMKQLTEQLDAPGEGDGIANLGVLDLPGCFAIARYGKLELAKDPTSFTGIYVGKAACVGEGIARTIAPTGNADVYADIQYKQNVVVDVFTWPADKIDEKHEALVQLFAAGESYNRVEMGVTDEEYVSE